MPAQNYPHLFSPIIVNGTMFRNRIFASPTGFSFSDSDGLPMPEVGAYYERKAMGGAASVCMSGNSGVNRSGMAYGGGLIPYSGSRGFYGYITNAITRHGAVAAIELQHGGSHSDMSHDRGETIYSADAGIYRGVAYEAMTEEIIRQTIRDFAAAAAAAKRMGFGMVTVHGGHGWLIHQFLSPNTNHRTDRWGGSVENRTRLAREICMAIREAVPDLVVELRISGSEGTPEGFGIEEGIEIAKALDGYPHILHVSAGSSAFTVTHPSMFDPDGVNVRFAAAIKPFMKKSLVATVGALTSPDQMEEIIASGQADIVELARGLIADPELPNKARTGCTGDINRCLRCYHCFSEAMSSGQYSCTLNPQIGREEEYSTQARLPQPKKVLVLGGGIAGMQAAVTAARRGHRVTLVEKSDRLGGVLLCEAQVPFKSHMADYIEKQIRRLSEVGVEVQLNRELSPAEAEAMGADVLIAAIGSEAAQPPIPGLETAVDVTDAYAQPEKLGERVVILGGGLAGSELAIYLRSLGRQAELVEMGKGLSFGSNMLHGQAVGEQLRRYAVPQHLGAKVTAIEGGAVLCETADGPLRLEADSIVNALGRKGRQEAAAAYALCAPIFYPIGDCLAARTVYEANRLGYHVAMDIGC